MKIKFKYPHLNAGERELLGRIGILTPSIDRRGYELELQDDFSVFLKTTGSSIGESIFYKGVQIFYLSPSFASSSNWFNGAALQLALYKTDAYTPEDHENFIKKNFENRLRNALYYLGRLLYGHTNLPDATYAQALLQNILAELRSLKIENPTLHDEIIASHKDYQFFQRKLPGWNTTGEIATHLEARFSISPSMRQEAELSHLDPDSDDSGASFKASVYVEQATEKAFSKYGTEVGALDLPLNIDVTDIITSSGLPKETHAALTAFTQRMIFIRQRAFTPEEKAVYLVMARERIEEIKAMEDREIPHWDEENPVRVHELTISADMPLITEIERKFETEIADYRSPIIPPEEPLPITTTLVGESVAGVGSIGIPVAGQVHEPTSGSSTIETPVAGQVHEPTSGSSTIGTPVGEQTHKSSAESTSRAALKGALEDYIARIERNNLGGHPDYTYGFWVFKNSRAVNREANYLLAKSLLAKLDQLELPLREIFTDINQQRQVLISEHRLDKRTSYVERGINSKELNKIIQDGLKAGKKELKEEDREEDRLETHTRGSNNP